MQKIKSLCHKSTLDNKTSFFSSFANQVMRISSLTGDGLPELWSECLRFKQSAQECGDFEAQRRRQLLVWMWTYVRNSVMDVFKADKQVKVYKSR